MSLNPLNDISAVYMKEVLEPKLGKKTSAPEAKGGEKKEGAGATSEKRIRQAVYDIRYRARREDVPLEQAFSQYMGHTSMNAVEKKEVKEKLGLGPAGGSVSEEVKDAKYQVRVKDKATGKSYVRYATREKINQLRANPNISSVEMTKYGTPYEGEKDRGEYTAKTKAGKGLDPVGREDKDIDNDGDHDKTDKYLLNRRKVRGAEIAKRNVKEGYSNWREDLREVVDDNIAAEKKKEVKEKKINNKVVINPKLAESIQSLGGELIDVEEIDEAVYGGTSAKKEEPKDTRLTVTAADKKGNTAAYQRYKAGDKKYKAAPHLGEENIEEKAVSKAQQRFMGMVYAAKKGEMPASSEVAKAAAGISKKEAKKFAKTKHSGLPEVKEAIDAKIQDQPTPADNKVRSAQSDAVKKQQLQNLKMIQQKKQMLDRQRLQMQKSEKLPLNTEEVEIEEGKQTFPAKKVAKQMEKARQGSVYAKTGNPAVPSTTDAEKKNTTRFSKMHHASEKAKREKQEADKARRSSTFYKDTHPASAPKMKKANEEIEHLDELNRAEKETGVNTKTGKTTSSGGSMAGDKAFQHVSKMMRKMQGKPAGQQKKVPGKKPPVAGQYGGPQSPAQKVAARRAAAKRSQDNMTSRYD